MSSLVKNIVKANKRIKAVSGGVRETPLDLSGVFSAQTGAKFLLKGEHLQRTGSFKMRGAMNKVLSLTDKQRAAGIITASSGNHGMATTQAALVVGVQVTVYLPETVPSPKLATMQRMGAKTVLVPGNGVLAEVQGRAAAEAAGKVFVSPYSDPDVIAGQGTIGFELAEQCPELAAVYVCVGGGGLISGIGSYLKSALPSTEIIGCWPANATAMHACLEKGEIYDVPETPTLSDASAGGIEEGAITFPICTDVIDRHLLIAEAEIASAIGDMAVHENFMIEGAAGVALAAGLKDAHKYKDRNVAVIICGRNIAMATFLEVMAGYQNNSS